MTEYQPMTLLMNARQEAKQNQDPSAKYCTLATLEQNDASQPRMRTLVVREINADSCVLFVNKLAQKNLLHLNEAKVELLFFYPSLLQQFRVRGELSLMCPEVLETHWQHKPYISKLLDHFYHTVAHQSAALEGSFEVERGINALKEKYPNPDTVPFTDNALGLVVSVNYLEYWRGHETGLHERTLYRHIGHSWELAALVP